MQDQIQESWRQLQESVSIAQNISAITLAAYLLLGGFLALYIRLLYRYYGSSASDSDSITRVFPLLTLVTIGVICVVKSSLALSLGLVGALSIVRFRAAIKEPEELVYLFLCIGVGLALGAGLPLLAVVLVLAATVFIVGMHLAGRGRRQHHLLLTITGDTERHFGNDCGALTVVEELAGQYTLQRCDIENGRGQVRLVLNRAEGRETVALMAQLRERLPDCEFSYVNMNSVF
ncbi:MAG: DUF4956 domain-containing protein [Planctomycetaceae bacterium]|nr:DUF4956 domain-containing protein [Planctomycetaceae bacterium]